MRFARSGTAGDGQHVYAIGLGSNRPLSARLGPRAIIRAAMAALDGGPGHVLARSPIMDSRPIGPSQRIFANAALLLASPLPPQEMLSALHGIEARFGRQRRQRWGARTLDLDILLWSGGRCAGRHLTIPHAALHQRDFALFPLAHIAPNWPLLPGPRTVGQVAYALRHRKAS